MKYGQTLLHQSVPEWRKKYIDYKALKKAIKRINISKQNALNEMVESGNLIKTGSRLLHEFSSSFTNILSELPEEAEFRKLLDAQLDKINNFYAEREIEIVNKLVLIIQQIEIYTNNSEIKKGSAMEAFKGVFLHKKRDSFSKDLETSDPSVYNDVKFKSKKAKSKLKNALLELYREMFLLKNYKILNYTGFVKILKKYDKVMKRNFSNVYITKVDNSHFHTSKILEKVIKQTENIYIKTFSNGNRNAGMNDLRLPDELGNEQHSVIWRAGFCLGLGLPIIYSIVSTIIKEDLTEKIDNLEVILQIFGGLSLPIIFLLLFGINLIVWKRFKINYVFIFEFDSRKHLSPWEFIEISCFLFVLWIYFVYFAITDFFPFITTHLYPLILLFIYLGLLLLPFKIFYFQARWWIVKIIGRLVGAPFYYVRFADFFLGDQFMSISYIFTVIEILICAEFHNFKNMDQKCNSSTSWFISIVTVVPGWIRFLQCLRRYYNTHSFNPHLLNAGKYLVGIISILMGTLARVKGHSYLRIIWIISLVATSSYSYTWDVLMDWGFFQKNSKNKFLRNDLIFPIWSYYYVMISNLFLRTIWLFTVSPNYWGVIKNGNIVAYGTALVEVFRRFQWNFFRMENEHTNNCGQFRAVKEMPLPYNINNNFDDDEESTGNLEKLDESNFQNFVKKFSKYKNNENDDNSSTKGDGNIEDITDVTKDEKDLSKYFKSSRRNSSTNNGQDKDKNYQNSGNDTNNNELNNDLNDNIRKRYQRTNLNNNNLGVKRSHSQELVNLNSISQSSTESGTFNVFNVKFWNIKPYKFKNKCHNFDFQDPYNSNRTVHTYNVDSEFHQYIAKLKENLSSIDTIIKRYDTKHENNQLTIKIENFNNKQQKYDTTEFSEQNSHIPNRSSSRMDDPNTSKSSNINSCNKSDTIKLDSSSEESISSNSKIDVVTNSPKPIIKHENLSHSSLANSESITLYSVK